MRKMTILAAVVVMGLASSMQALGQDRAGATVRYRSGSTVMFDSTSKMADEDSLWTLSSAQLGKLAVLQGGRVAMTTNTSKTVTFATAFSAAPAVVVSGRTNDLAHVVSVTTTNAVLGAAQTNATLSWVAFGSP